MKKKLLIVFVKNIKLGKVKTRLAKTIGNEGAFEVYKELVAITEKVTSTIDFEKIIYFSDVIIEDKWNNIDKKVQFGVDLGARMQNAFIDGFNLGYESIVLVGSDLPEITKDNILKAFDALQTSETVFGPAQDGGYYLIGMNKLYPCVFEDKPWSRPNLLEVTTSELKQNNTSFLFLETLNDIDTYDDLIASDFYKDNTQLQQKLKQFNDQYYQSNN